MYSSSGSWELKGMAPRPCKISHKKDGHQRQPHRIHVSQPPEPAAPHIPPSISWKSKLQIIPFDEQCWLYIYKMCSPK